MRQWSHAAMNTGLLAMLVLTSWVQEKKEWRPIPAAPARSRVINIGVRIGGNVEIRQITVSIPAPPAPADEDDEHQPARPVGRIEINSVVVERENFDRWLFGEQS